MRQYRLWIEIAAVVVVAVAAFFIGRVFFPANQPVAMNANEGPGQGGSMPQSPTKEDVPENTSVPDQQSGNLPDNVAKPDIVIPAAPGVDSKKRIFNISIDGGQFKPDTVIVKVGDIAHITFTAMDAAYTIVQPDYGFSLDIPKGESKLLEAQFTQSGKYLFYCSSCGGPDKGPKGYFTVVP